MSSQYYFFFEKLPKILKLSNLHWFHSSLILEISNSVIMSRNVWDNSISWILKICCLQHCCNHYWNLFRSGRYFNSGWNTALIMSTSRNIIRHEIVILSLLAKMFETEIVKTCRRQAVPIHLVMQVAAVHQVTDKSFSLPMCPDLFTFNSRMCILHHFS